MEDAYAFYVLIAGLPEDAFWSMELSSLLSIVGDKLAYDSYLASEQIRILENRGRSRGPE